MGARTCREGGLLWQRVDIWRRWETSSYGRSRHRWCAKTQGEEKAEAKEVFRYHFKGSCLSKASPFSPATCSPRPRYDSTAEVTPCGPLCGFTKSKCFLLTFCFLFVKIKSGHHKSFPENGKRRAQSILPEKKRKLNHTWDMWVWDHVGQIISQFHVVFTSVSLNLTLWSKSEL